MTRTKGAKNKNTDALPHYAKLPVEERLQFLATLIVDRIQSDQQSGSKLLKQAERQKDARPNLFA